MYQFEGKDYMYFIFDEAWQFNSMYNPTVYVPVFWDGT